VYAAAVAGLGYIVARGYERTFESSTPAATPLLLPVLSSTF
jgi:positive regulator of sigma E activity